MAFEKLEEVIKAEDELNKSLKLSHDFHNTGYTGEAIDKLARGEINTDEARDIFQQWLNTDYKDKSYLWKLGHNKDKIKDVVNNGVFGRFQEGAAETVLDTASFFTRLLAENSDGALGDWAYESLENQQRISNSLKKATDEWHQQNPDKWNVAGGLGEFGASILLDPVTYAAPELKGASLAKRALFYAGMGATQPAMAEYGRSGDLEKTKEEAAKGALFGMGLGFAFEGGYKLYQQFKGLWNKGGKADETLLLANNNKNNDRLGYEGKKYIPFNKKWEDFTWDKPEDFVNNTAEYFNQRLNGLEQSKKANILQDILDGKTSSEHINSETFADLKQWVDNALKLYNQMFYKEGTKQLINTVKTASDESLGAHNNAGIILADLNKKNPNLTKEQLINLLNKLNPLTQNEIVVSDLVNNSNPVDPRLGGFRGVHLLEKSIENNNVTPQYIYESFRNAGYSDEFARVAMEAYSKKDAKILRAYMAEKIANGEEALKSKILKKGDLNNRFWYYLYGKLKNNDKPDGGGSGGGGDSGGGSGGGGGGGGTGGSGGGGDGKLVPYDHEVNKMLDDNLGNNPSDLDSLTNKGEQSASNRQDDGRAISKSDEPLAKNAESGLTKDNTRNSGSATRNDEELERGAEQGGDGKHTKVDDQDYSVSGQRTGANSNPNGLLEEHTGVERHETYENNEQTPGGTNRDLLVEQQNSTGNEGGGANGNSLPINSKKAKKIVKNIRKLSKDSKNGIDGRLYRDKAVAAKILNDLVNKNNITDEDEQEKAHKQIKKNITKARREYEQLENLPVNKQYGENYAEYTNSGAFGVQKVLEEKTGQVTGAFYRDDLGDIDVYWGGTNKGLALIQSKNIESSWAKNNRPSFLANQIANAVQKGELSKNDNKASITYKDDNKKYTLKLTKDKDNWKLDDADAEVLEKELKQEPQKTKKYTDEEIAQTQEDYNKALQEFKNAKKEVDNQVDPKDKKKKIINDTKKKLKAAIKKHYPYEPDLTKHRDGIQRYRSKYLESYKTDKSNGSLGSNGKKAEAVAKELEPIFKEYDDEIAKNNLEQINYDKKLDNLNAKRKGLYSFTDNKSFLPHLNNIKDNSYFKSARILFDEGKNEEHHLEDAISRIKAKEKDLTKEELEQKAREFLAQYREKLNKDIGVEPLSEFGTNYAEFYHDPIGAFKKLEEEKTGQVAGAFYRDDLGDIDLVWGKVTGKNKGYGLAHIIDKHPKLDLNLLPEVISNGTLYKTHNGYNIEYKNYKIGLNHGWNKNGVKEGDNNWIVTSYEKNGQGSNSATNNIGEILPKTSQDSIIPQNNDLSKNYDLREFSDEPLSKKQREAINKQVEDILNKSEITPSDRDILALYSGKGGIDNESKGGLSEFYTPLKLIDSIFNAIEEAGYKIDNALEPSMGSGRFMGMRPEINWTGTDIDKTAYEVASKLYPQAKLYNNDFEDIKAKDFDLVISNIPFLDQRFGNDRADIKTLHDYFFIKALEQVKDGGIVAFVTSKGVADKLNNAIRDEIISKADIIGMYRLPNGAFQNSHTDVGTDIIFLRKRAKNEIPSEIQARDNEAFINTVKGENAIAINEYYNLYPQNILGTMRAKKNRFGKMEYYIDGKHDYSNIKLNSVSQELQKAKEAANAQKYKDNEIPTNSIAFKEWENNNDVPTASKEAPDFIEKDGKYYTLDNIIEFDDINDVRKIYKEVSKENKAKIDMLKELAELAKKHDEEGFIKLLNKYKKKYKKHPFYDPKLKKEVYTEKLAELGSYFTKDFKPTDAVKMQTKFENSGKKKVDSNSPLNLRLAANLDNKGIIDLDKSKFVNSSESAEAIKEGYSIVGHHKLQNDILYYSGNLYEKIDEARKMLQTAKKPELIKQLQSQIDKLNEILPKKIEYADINFNGMESWLRDNGVHLYGYEIVKKTDKNGKTTTEIKTNDKILSNYLNGRKLITRNKEWSDITYKTKYLEATQYLEDKLNALKTELIEKNPQMLDKIEDIYNRKFNFYKEPDYSKASFLIQKAVDLADKSITFRQNQLNWVAKALFEGKGVNSHDVGGGKTISGVLLAKSLKELGMAKKPLIVVPSKVAMNWVREIKRVYPNAKIVNLSNLPKATRAKDLMQYSNMEADFTIITHEGFEALKLPGDYAQKIIEEYLNRNFSNIELKGQAKAKAKEKIQAIAKLFMENNAEKGINFADLGFDAIIMDEARAFKNIGYDSKLVSKGLATPMNLISDEKGINISSKSSYDAMFKANFIADHNNNGNVFLLDATPTPNKPMELYTMLTTLDRNILLEYGITNPTEFANRFFKNEPMQIAGGAWKDALSEITNVFDLMRIKDRFFERIPMEAFSDNGINIPKKTEIKHVMEQSIEGEEANQDALRLIKEAKEQQDLGKIGGAMQKAIVASSDPRLYGLHPELSNPTIQNNKIMAVVDLAARRRKLDKQAGQIIFLDNSGKELVKNGHLKEDLHKEIKQQLINTGEFKEGEIAIIGSDYITDPKTGKEVSVSGAKAMGLKQAVSDAYNNGDLKIIIGTTKTAGEGMNLQKFTRDIYNVNLPWTKAEMEQRAGRGVRSGNVYDEVNIHNFFTENSFDSKMAEAINKKSDWNDILWNIKKEDLKNTMKVNTGQTFSFDPRLMEIELEKDPYIKAKKQAEFDHEKLLNKQNALYAEMKYYQTKLETIDTRIKLNEMAIRKNEGLKNNETPTKILEDMLNSAKKQADKLKKEKLMQDYKKDLQEFRDRIDGYIRTSNSRIKNQILEKQKTKIELKQAQDNLNNMVKKIKDFEQAKFDENGEFKMFDGTTC